jgi:hypothetical protein
VTIAPTVDPGRCELKFVARDTLAHHVAAWLRTHARAFLEAHPPRWVNSVYFDSYDYTAYHRTLSGISERAKVRFRWYGPCPTPGSGALEVKLKRDAQGWKIAYPVASAPASPGATWREIAERIATQIPLAGRRWLDAHQQPVLISRFRRQYWMTCDGEIRATLDTDQSFYDQRYRPTPDLSRRANVAPTMVLEIKCTPAYADELPALLAGLPLTLSRNSKYCHGLRAMQSY